MNRFVHCSCFIHEHRVYYHLILVGHAEMWKYTLAIIYNWKCHDTCIYGFDLGFLCGIYVKATNFEIAAASGDMSWTQIQTVIAAKNHLLYCPPLDQKYTSDSVWRYVENKTIAPLTFVHCYTDCSKQNIGHSCRKMKCNFKLCYTLFLPQITLWTQQLPIWYYIFKACFLHSISTKPRGTILWLEKLNIKSHFKPIAILLTLYVWCPSSQMTSLCSKK